MRAPRAVRATVVAAGGSPRAPRSRARVRARSRGTAAARGVRDVGEHVVERFAVRPRRERGIPGVSMSHAPDGSATSSRRVDVCTPRPSDARVACVANAARRAAGSRASTCRRRTSLRARASCRRGGCAERVAAVAVFRADCDHRHVAAHGVQVRDESRGIAREIAFVQHDDGARAGCTDRDEITLDARRRELAPRSGDDADDVEIGRDGLRGRAAIVPCAREHAAARRERDDARAVGGGPVADDGPVGERRRDVRIVSSPSGASARKSAPRSDAMRWSKSKVVPFVQR